MKYTIKNEQIELTVNEVGAEMCSLKSVITGREFMWQGDPQVWSGQAPVLFPVIGGLKEGCYIFDDKKYSLPKHGFIRNNTEIELIEKSISTLTFFIKYNKDTLEKYPFLFEFKITFSLEKNTVVVSHEVANLDDKSIWFSVGAHPAFNCPHENDDDFNDYFLEFEKSEIANTWTVQQDGLIGSTQKPIMDQTNKLVLHKHIFDDDALVFKDLRSKVVILNKKGEGEILKVAFHDFPYLGIWAKPQSDFVCIEPWLGIADSWDSNQKIEEKEGMINLREGEIFNAEYTISPNVYI